MLITSADGSRVFLGKRKALRGYVEREVFPWIQIWETWPLETLLIREIRFPFSPFPGIVSFARCILNRIGILAYSNSLHGPTSATEVSSTVWLAFSGGALEVELSLVRVLKRQSAWCDFGERQMQGE